MTTLNDFKIIVNGSRADIYPANIRCQYGDRVYPSGKTLARYAVDHPNVKTFRLCEIPEKFTLKDFNAKAAWPTLQTKLTAGNKAINGISPDTIKSNTTIKLDGAGRVKTDYKFSAGTDYVEISSNDCSSTAKIMRTGQTMIFTGKLDNRLFRLAGDVMQSAQDGNVDALAKYIAVKHIAILDNYSVEIAQPVMSLAIPALAATLHEAGPEIATKLGAKLFTQVKIVTMGLDDFKRALIG